MTKDKEKTTNLNPEIYGKALELFDLIEEQFIKDRKTAKTGENMAEELGELLRSHQGMNELRFAYQIARTKSQEAEYGFEESTRYMRDDTLSQLHEFAQKSLEIIEILEGDRPFSHARHRIADIKEVAPKINRFTTGELKLRSTKYRDEIQKLKGNQ